MPYDRATFTGKTGPSRVMDLLGSDVIEVTCRGCLRQSLIAPHQLYARFDPTTTIDKALESAKCSRCGQQRVTWAWLRARAPRSFGDRW